MRAEYCRQGFRIRRAYLLIELAYHCVRRLYNKWFDLFLFAILQRFYELLYGLTKVGRGGATRDSNRFKWLIIAR